VFRKFSVAIAADSMLNVCCVSWASWFSYIFFCLSVRRARCWIASCENEGGEVDIRLSGRSEKTILRRAYLARSVTEFTHLLFIPRQFAVEFANFDFY
jgi:hypothetical protein